MNVIEVKSELKTTDISIVFNEDKLREIATRIYDDYFNITCANQLPAVKSYAVTNLGNKGDGYMGENYRLNIEYTDEKNVSVFVKGLPKNEVRLKTMQVAKFFATEVNFYKYIEYAANNIQYKYHGELFLNIPKSFYAYTDGKNDYLVLNDLSSLDYKMHPNSNGAIDSPYLESMLTTLGKYHALTTAFKFHDPLDSYELTKKHIVEHYFTRENEGRLGKYYYNLAQLFYRGVKEILNDTEYLKKFEDFIHKDKLYENILKTVEICEPAIFTQGDCWIKNFMFRNNGEEALLLDFQIARLGSPMLDFAVLIFACTTEDVRLKLGGIKGLLSIYYKAFMGSVQDLKVPLDRVASYDQMYKFWRKCGSHGLICALELVPLTLVELDNVVDLNSMEGTDAVPVEQLFTFSEITKVCDKQRLADLVKLAVNEELI